MRFVGKYEYESLRDAALAGGATQEDIDALGEWLYRYNMSEWNGECWDIGGGRRVFPVYRQIDEDDFELVGYRIS